MRRPLARLRALGLARGSLVLGVALATGVFFYMGLEGHTGEATAGIFLEVLLIAFVQQGIARRERVLFALWATALGLTAILAGSALSFAF